MKLAIIDDGVYPGFLQAFGNLERFTVTEGGRVVPDVSKSFFSHGTKVASIIRDLCVGCPVISVKVMDRDGRGRVEHLAAALTWCLEQNIQLIHMSIGTSNYHDFEYVKKWVDALRANGAMIVAAYDNYGTLSCPACLPGVFGVRIGKAEEDMQYRYAFDRGTGLPMENTLIASLKGDWPVTFNSYAAPVITAKILEFMCVHKNADFGAVLNHLDANQSDRVVAGKAFFDYSLYQGLKTEIPIIGAAKNVSKDIREFFRREGYHAELLSGDSIPKHLYTDGELDGGLTYVLNQIYAPDILIIETEKNARIFDFFVWGENQSIMTEERDGDKREFSGTSESCRYIVQYFS